MRRRRFKVCANLTASPQESLGVPRTLFKGFLAGSRAAPLVAAFLFCQAFFFVPYALKEKSGLTTTAHLISPTLHRCRRRFSYGVFSCGGFAACFIGCGCVIVNQSLALRERCQPKADGEGVRYLTPHPPRKLGTFSHWRRLFWTAHSVRVLH